MISINSSELESILALTPSTQNIMLAGRHGIGKSEILTKYFEAQGLKVVPLFLGQMADASDLLGLPNKDEATGKTSFMPPFWWPVDNQPIVLFLDELNRARPELLQVVMDLALNRKLAGKTLPEGSRIISAVNDGEEYTVNDLDPALVSRFNIYRFSPSVQEWLLWAQKRGIDDRVIGYISENTHALESVSKEDQGLEKTPDRRGWEKVSNLVKGVEDINTPLFHKLLGGVIGVTISSAFLKWTTENRLLSPSQILGEFATSKKMKSQIEKLKLADLTQCVQGVMNYIQASFNEDEGKFIFDMDETKLQKNAFAFFSYMLDVNGGLKSGTSRCETGKFIANMFAGGKDTSCMKAVKYVAKLEEGGVKMKDVLKEFFDKFDII